MRRAALAITWEGKRYSHQRRLKETDLNRAEKKLITHLAEIEKATGFAVLFDLVKRRVGNLGGLGELYVYDTALRIAAKKRMLPQRVYLHAGRDKVQRRLNLTLMA